MSILTILGVTFLSGAFIGGTGIWLIATYKADNQNTLSEDWRNSHSYMSGKSGDSRWL